MPAAPESTAPATAPVATRAIRWSASARLRDAEHWNVGQAVLPAESRAWRAESVLYGPGLQPAAASARGTRNRLPHLEQVNNSCRPHLPFQPEHPPDHRQQLLTLRLGCIFPQLGNWPVRDLIDQAAR